MPTATFHASTGGWTPGTWWFDWIGVSVTSESTDIAGINGSNGGNGQVAARWSSDAEWKAGKLHRRQSHLQRGDAVPWLARVGELLGIPAERRVVVCRDSEAFTARAARLMPAEQCMET